MSSKLKDLSVQFLADRHILMSFIYGLVREPNAAEDIFQEVWMKLAGAAEKGVEIENLVGWCRGVAKNLILHHWRSNRTSKVLVDSELVDLVDQAFTEQDYSRDKWSARRQALVECIRSLPQKSKRILALKYELGLSAALVAKRLRKSAASIMMALSRARRSLAQCIEKKLDTEPGR